MLFILFCEILGALALYTWPNKVNHSVEQFLLKKLQNFSNNAKFWEFLQIQVSLSQFGFYNDSQSEFNSISIINLYLIFSKILTVQLLRCKQSIRLESCVFTLDPASIMLFKESRWKYSMLRRNCITIGLQGRFVVVLRFTFNDFIYDWFVYYHGTGI